MLILQKSCSAVWFLFLFWFCLGLTEYFLLNFFFGSNGFNCFEVYQMRDCWRWRSGQDLHANLLHKQQIPYCMFFNFLKYSPGHPNFWFFFVSFISIQFFILRYQLGFAAFLRFSKFYLHHSLSTSLFYLSSGLSLLR